MIVYFTGTGNSRYCAQALAQKLGEECRDAAEFLKTGRKAKLQSDTPWVFVCPTYAWQMPRVFADFIRQGEFGGSKQAYFVMTCGGETGRAWQQNQELCREKGFECRGTLPVVMPDNYIVLFKAPSPRQAEEMVQEAGPRLEAAARFIREGKAFPAIPAAAMDGLKSGFINQMFYRFQIRAEKFRVTEACIGCGRCAQLCPLDNIRMEEGRPRWGKHCTHCTACLNGCPTGAIEYGKATKGKERYHFPEKAGQEGQDQQNS